MATVKKREGKNGVSYLIRSSCGYDLSGRHVEKSMTWKPSPGMTPRQIEKELNRQAVLFDEQCAAQGVQNGNIKFEALARQWLEEYAEPNLRPRTVARLHQLEERTYQGIGHIRVDKLTARHIQKFINNLGEEGISTVKDKAKAKAGLTDLLGEMNLTQKALSKKVGVSRSVLSAICRGESTTFASAEKVAKGLGKPVSDLFVVTKAKTTLSPKTIKHYLSFVSDVMQYAVRFDMIPSNPCSRVTVPSAPQTEREVYSLEEAQRFLDSLEKAPTKYRAFFVLAIYGGLRRGEILGLEWKDLDFENHVIKVQRTSLYSKDLGTFTDTTKNKTSTRTLKLPAAVFAILRQHRAEQAEERLRQGDHWKDHDRLFTNLNGEPMHPNTPYHWLKRFCEETGQRFLGVHAFRHLNASLLINSGADVVLVSKSLGHSNVSTTLNIYSHTFEEAQARASDAVADLLSFEKKA